MTKQESAGDKTPILTLRGAVLVLLAGVTGAGVGLLTFAAHRELADAILAGLTAAGASLLWYDRVIARESITDERS